MKHSIIVTYWVRLTLPFGSVSITVMETWYNWLKDHLIAWMWHAFTQPKRYNRLFPQSSLNVLVHQQQNRERLIPSSLTGTAVKKLMWHVNDSGFLKSGWNQFLICSSRVWPTPAAQHIRAHIHILWPPPPSMLPAEYVKSSPSMGLE